MARDALVLDLLDEALGWPPDERDARLAERCAGDADLHAEVRRLLDRDRVAGLILPTVAQTGESVERRAPPERIGPYRLVDVLGVGGMGTVYRGERDDGLFQQTVAIKLVRPGLLSAQASELFAQERRLLARLRHPGIAQLFDGGADADGRGYLVMEFVEGEPITSHVSRTRLSRDDTIALFERVCDAVQHAHQSLVVHADIKPSNILVTAGGAVKLLDFGIGRFIEAGETHGARSDSSGPMTRAYAAPERIAGELPGIAGDVYSLGMLLRELLGDDALDDELAAILDKATAKDPATRYASVDRLADDLSRRRRHLTVGALPASWTYATRCFVRRHRTGLALTALAMVALVVATAVSTTLYLRAERARVEADRRFAELRELSNFMIFDLYDDLTRIPGAVQTRERVVTRAQGYLDALGSQPNAPLDVKLETAIGYGRLATVLGVPTLPNLGDAAAAKRNLAESERRLESLHAQAPQRADVAIELANVLALRGLLAIWGEQKSELAAPLISRAESLLAIAPSAEGLSEMRRAQLLERRLDVRQLLHRVAADYLDFGNKPELTRRRVKLALAELDTWPAAMRTDERWPANRARFLNKLGDAVYYSDSREEALRIYREAESVVREASERLQNHPALLTMRLTTSYNIATTLVNTQHAAESLPLFDEAISLNDRLLELERQDQQMQRQRHILVVARAETLSNLGRFDEAIESMQREVEATRMLAAAAPADASRERDVAWIQLPLGDTYWRADKRQLACEAWDGGIERFAILRGKGAVSTWDNEYAVPDLTKRAQLCAGRLPASAFPELAATG